jgi:hypothetical protein
MRSPPAFNLVLGGWDACRSHQAELNSRTERSALVVVGLTIAPAGALAANPTVMHFTDSGTFTDPDFCGTGETVNGSFSVRGTEFLTPNQPGIDYRNTTVGNTYLTNPANGNTIRVHFAGQFTATVVSSDANGFTELDTNIGAPEVIKTPHGGVLTRDAGYIQFLNTFDSDGNLVSGQVVIDRGPHPEAEQDFELFCNVATSALGL